MSDFIVWQEQYSVGIDSIDVQHKMVIDLLNNNYQALKNGAVTRAYVDDFLDRLLIYTETHFRYEEMLMEFAGFDHLREHAQYHREMCLKTKGISLSLTKDFTEQFQLAHKMLRDWWLHHILEIDREYVPFFMKSAFRPGLPPGG